MPLSRYVEGVLYKYSITLLTRLSNIIEYDRWAVPEFLLLIEINVSLYTRSVHVDVHRHFLSLLYFCCIYKVQTSYLKSCSQYVLFLCMLCTA